MWKTPTPSHMRMSRCSLEIVTRLLLMRVTRTWSGRTAGRTMVNTSYLHVTRNIDLFWIVRSLYHLSLNKSIKSTPTPWLPLPSNYPSPLINPPPPTPVSHHGDVQSIWTSILASPQNIYWACARDKQVAQKTAGGSCLSLAHAQ